MLFHDSNGAIQSHSKPVNCGGTDAQRYGLDTHIASPPPIASTELSVGEMVLSTVMFTRKQHIRINLLAVFALFIGLVAAVPHYGHADVLHDVSSHSQNIDDNVVDDTSDDNVVENNNDGSTANECDHGCHLGHHFNGVLGGNQNTFTQIAKQSPTSNPYHFSLITKRRDLRPPIFQIS